MNSVILHALEVSGGSMESYYYDYFYILPVCLNL